MFLLLFRLQTVYRIAGGCPVILYRNGDQGDGADKQAGTEEDPRRDGNPFIELLQPF